MRVLQAMAGATLGGAESFFVDLALALSRAELVPEILMRENLQRTTALRKAGLNVLELPFNNEFSDLHTRVSFAKAIQSYNPDIVLTWMSRATSFCPKSNLAQGRKNFIHVGWLGGYYNLSTYRNCDYLIALTPDLLTYFAAGGWTAARTVCLPVFTSAPDPQSVAAARSLYDTPEAVPLALALGRFHENKGFDVLIAALKEVPSLYLWLAGAGPLKSSLESWIASAGVGQRVRLIDWQDDVTPLMLAADFFVCPSRHEPFGRVIIEAWAHRLPVIATASQGPKQLIVDHNNGLLTPIDDVGALANAMQHLVDNQSLRESLVQAGYETFLNFYEEKLVIKAYLEFFARILKT